MHCTFFLLTPSQLHCVLVSLHSDYFYIFFYQGSSATADVHEDIVLRFAHDDLYDSQFANFGNRFYVLNAADRYNEVPFDYHFEINTPFPYHAELHINRTQFDYEGEYFIAYDYYSLGPHFIIDVNGKFCMALANQIRCIITM